MPRRNGGRGGSLGTPYAKATRREVSELSNGIGLPLQGSTNQMSNYRTSGGDYLFAKERINGMFNPNNLVANESFDLLKLIIQMPAGYRLSKNYSKLLEGCPLGYFVEVLKYKMVELGMSSMAQKITLDSIMVVGEVIEIENQVYEGQPQPNLYNNQEGMYTPRDVVPVVHTYEFRQIALSSFYFTWWFPYPFEETVQFDDQPVELMLKWHPDGHTRTFRPASGTPTAALTFNNYYNLQTKSEFGSDASFFCLSRNSFLYKRFRPVDEVNLPPNLRSRIVRTAGLRQVLLYTIEEELYLPSLLNKWRVFCPGGDSGNCFDACVKEGVTLFFTMEEFYRMHDVVFTAVRKAKSVNDFKYFYQNGYSTMIMNEIAEQWLFHKIALFVFRRNRKGQWENIIKHTRDMSESDLNGRYGIFMFQVTDGGTILDTSVLDGEGDDGSLGHMLHMVSITPFPTIFLNKGGYITAGTKNALATLVETFLTKEFCEMYERARYWKDITADNIQDLVEKQQKRHAIGYTETLIFEPERKRMRVDGGESSGYQDKWLRDISDCPPQYIVFAYDVETVDNDPSNYKLVYEPFRKDPMSDCYVSKESQIPWSCQWVAVNLSDRGKFLQMKESAGLNVNHYCPDGNSTVPGYEEFFLNTAQTVYGEPMESGDSFYFGSCVEKMLMELAMYCYERAAKIGYAYAHNGAHFDSFVILQFQRFPITKILKTSRGVMSVSIRVPVALPGVHWTFEEGRLVMSDESPQITIILRDTMLHVPGSLSRLCKGFNVPKEFCKLDYPIQLLDMSTCYNPEILKDSKPYGENDVYALAYIIRCINDLIGDSPWKPASIRSMKPPIAQFLTCMSMVRKSTENHFKDSCVPRNLWPKAVDLPALRNWLIGATIGGRVSAYARGFFSSLTSSIIYHYLQNDKESLKEDYKKMVELKDCMRTLDFTSLYPNVTSKCPMPTGKIEALSINDCRNAIDAIYCKNCEEFMTLCPDHNNDSGKVQLRPFAIIIVSNMRPTQYMKLRMRNMCGRKVYKKSTGKCVELNYSLESREEFKKRRPDYRMRKVDSFTNIDLYWMSKQGFDFDIIGGFGFSTSTIYHSFIGPAFKQRIKAKKEGNKLMSDFLKLNYNGAYGVTIQQDITESFIVCDVPKDLMDSHPYVIQKHILEKSKNGTNSKRNLLVSEELTGEAFYLPSGQGVFQKKKKEHLAEYYMAQSPMQIGAAILAWARHVANLVMFSFPPEDITYTDTDSICLREKYMDSLESLINERDDAPMGTLKNDQGENNGTNPRIFCSLIGGRKVKMHITLNEEGEIKIFNTFKGLNVSLEDPDDNTILYSERFSDFVTSRALIELNAECAIKPIAVQSWKRDLGKGVSIGTHMQEFNSGSYLSDCQGTFNPTPGSEHFIPHGYPLSCLEKKEARLVKIKDNDEYTLEPNNLVYGNYQGLIDLVNKYYDVETIRNPYSGGAEYDLIVEKIKKNRLLKE